MGSGFGQNVHIIQELGNAAGMVYVDAGYLCMSEEAVANSEKCIWEEVE